MRRFLVKCGKDFRVAVDAAGNVKRNNDGCKMDKEDLFIRLESILSFLRNAKQFRIIMTELQSLILKSVVKSQCSDFSRHLVYVTFTDSAALVLYSVVLTTVYLILISIDY